MTGNLFLGLTAIICLLAGWLIIRLSKGNEPQSSLRVFILEVAAIFLIGLMAIYALHLPSAWSSK